MCREKALTMYCHLHTADAYVTKDKERQQALAEYTNKTTKQVRAAKRGCTAHVSVPRVQHAFEQCVHSVAR